MCVRRLPREKPERLRVLPPHAVTSLSTFRKAYCDSLVGTMAISKLSWSPQVNLDEGLEKTIAYFKLKANNK